ncbi:MAG: CDP-diacylglycerol--glycerol-3-phosphate 3-phosphatidyltransferase [Candidatus Cloacimonetes bacterium]|nr:CDP-diacylglycerol--glycerol-3-phosphate 3-phosphatidyltransferase [Candidatus Cloacimonadota bacterium]
MKIKRHIPNMLTISRILLVPIYLICLYLIGDQLGAELALLVFIVAGITDFFDGVLARKFKSITDFGKVVDPLADKIIVSVALITIALSPIELTSIYVAYIVILREILVTILRSWYQKKNIYIAANFWGKLKTTFQMTGIIASLLLYAGKFRFEFIRINMHRFTDILQIFFWLVVVITIVSGITYLPFLKKNNVKG